MVSAALPAEAVGDVIARAFQDGAAVPTRLASEISDGPGLGRTLLAMPALRRGGIAICKLVTVQRAPGTRLASHILAIDRDGRLLAVVEAHTLTVRRTAAVSVLAAQALGAGRARHLTVLGAGPQARGQLEAFAAALPLATVTVWARRPETAEELAAWARSVVPEVRVAGTAGEAVRDAEVITCATRSQAPLVRGADVAPGTHVDLVGGFRPDMREADDVLMTRASVVVDTPAALVEAGDLVSPLANDVLQRHEMRSLGEVLSGKPPAKAGDVTVFKSVGHAGADLVVAELLLSRLGIAGSPDDEAESVLPEHAHG